MLSKFKKAVAAAASAVFILTSAVALPASALETLAADSEGNSIAVEFPSSDKDKKVVGNSGIDITGTAAAGSSLTVSAEGKNVGTATVGADGKFTASVPSYALSSGLNEIVLSDGAGASASVEVNKQNYYDLADLDYNVTGAAQVFKSTGVSKYCPTLSVGGQTVKTNNGFSVVPADGKNAAPADATFDLSALGSVAYFHSVIGVDDFANIAGAVLSSAEYSVLADGKELVKSRAVTPWPEPSRWRSAFR